MVDATPIHIPLENVNDDSVILVGWLVADGADVKEGEIIAEIETSKALIDLVSPGDGKIALIGKAGQEIKVGTVIAYLQSSAHSGSQLPTGTQLNLSPANLAIPSAGPRFSRRASELMERHGLSPTRFGNHRMVREADVNALLRDVRIVEEERPNVHRAARTIALGGITLPALISDLEGKLDTQFLDYLRINRISFGRLSSVEKCALYREHGAVIGEEVAIGQDTVLIAPQLVLRDGVRIGNRGSVNCSEQFVAGRLSSFRSGLNIEASAVVLGENIFGCCQVEISGGFANPWSVLYIGDTTFIGDDVILDVSRPVLVGKEVFVAQRAIVITHNIGNSILEGYENRFEPVVLEDFCQVGMNSTVYAGSRVGLSAIVGSNSYVVSHIPAGKLAIGVPARVVRDAVKEPSRTQQIQIAQQMVRDFRDLLDGKGLNVSPVADNRFTLEHEGKHFLLVFTEKYSETVINMEISDFCVVWTLAASAASPPSCAVIDLLGKKVDGEGSIFLETAREFLRKRGIRCLPGPWRYRQGLI